MLLPRGLSVLVLSLGVVPPVLPPAPSDPSPAPGSGFPSVGQVLFTDDATSPAADLWGKVDCARRDRAQVVESGFGGTRTGLADAAPEGQFRVLRVVDGDDVWGERCELGENWRPSTPMPLFAEGERRITYISFRLPQNFPLHSDRWQAVMQMKQTQPADAGGGNPVLSLHVYDRRWRFFAGGRGGSQVWSAPAKRGRWVRVAFDITYSTDPRLGAVAVRADLNNDGDALDRGEHRRRRGIATLKAEGPGTAADGLGAGEPIASHLRVGVYHDPRYRCKRNRCSVAVDNVGVYGPP